MRFLRRHFNPIEALCFEVAPDPGNGGAGGVVAADGAVQPGAEGVAPGQGEAPPQQDANGFWSLFPDVPDEHRGLIEPHVRRMVGEVTRIQQQYAPYKELADAGYGEQELKGVVQFDQRFRSDPVGTFNDMMKFMQQNKLISDDLDVEAVIAIATGQDAPEEPAAQPTTEGLDPNVAAYIKQLEDQVSGINSRLDQDASSRQQMVEDNLLQRQMTKMKEALKQAGYSDEHLTDQRLTAAIMAHNGDIGQATKDLLDLRTGVLKGFTEQRQQPGDLEVRNGGPQPKQPVTRVRDQGDSFATARQSATARLRRANQAAAQG